MDFPRAALYAERIGNERVMQTAQHLDVAILGNSITLTPGTLTLDVYEGRLLVHALTPEGAESLRRGEMQRRVAALRKR